MHHFCGDPSKKTWPESGHKEISDGPKMRGILQKERPVLFKISQDLSGRENLRKGSRMKLPVISPPYFLLDSLTREEGLMVATIQFETLMGS